MDNLKLYGMFFIIGFVLAFGLGYKLFNKPQVESVKTLTNTEYKTKYVKITEPSGKVSETSEVDFSEVKRSEVKIVNKKYSASLFRNYDFNTQKDNYEAGIYRRVFDDFYIGFKANSENQFGVGFIKMF